MNIFEVFLFSISIGALFWLIVVAWEEWKKRILSDITLSALASSLFAVSIVILIIFDKI